MATKAQKRARGEAKAKREAEERRQSGLAAQKADREAREAKETRLGEAANAINQKHRSTLLNNGINPSTGEIFTDEEMAEMERKANTPERRHLFERIKAGRAGLLNEQPPLNMSDYTEVDSTDDPFGGMTVGQFREVMDKNWAATMEQILRARR